MTQEEIRLQESIERSRHWHRWGPYVSDRAWGTVREDYSPHGNAWEYFPFDHAKSRAYRWGEDGIAGICDRHQKICFALSLWNGRDPFLKERFFGLTGNQGNHGEDVKEYYFYLDSTPTHSYMKCLYKYPQAEFPYQQLIDKNRRGRNEPEFELLDTGVFENDRYFDVFVEYAKADVEDICVRITAVNRGPGEARLDLLPTMWFRNVWSWNSGASRPALRRAAGSLIEIREPQYGERWLECEGASELLFTENDTNFQRLFGVGNSAPYVKDGINDYIVEGRRDAVNPGGEGTKASARYPLRIAPGGQATIRLRFAAAVQGFADFDEIFHRRKSEADEFYRKISMAATSDDARLVQRQAFAGLFWSKQFYYYDMKRWLNGDPGQPSPPAERKWGRNSAWTHLFNADVISMPDKWEYPWYAAWDLAFHCVPIALADPQFAKDQLILMLREWYMHPNGQIPAYEWELGDVNPPVHGWAALRVYKIDQKRSGKPDVAFLEKVFHKLLLNFTWWVNRKDVEDNNLFQGGFLGLDNIGVFDRSAPLPTGGYLEQSDGTSWMAFYTLVMLNIAIELSFHNKSYEDVASKFFEHFVHINHAMNHIGPRGVGLWDEEDGFYYDVLHLPNGEYRRMKVRSMVGLIPLIAVGTLEPRYVDRIPGFRRRMEWFLRNSEDIQEHIDEQRLGDGSVRRLLSVVNLARLPRVLRYLFDENEFLSPHGIRALSRCHLTNPYRFFVNGQEYRVDYEPAESSTGLFGGNSNWRGPVWFPVNILIIEALQRFHFYLGDSYRLEYPTSSGNRLTLWEIAADLSRRLNRIFLRDENGRRPVYGATERFQTDPHWRDLIQFHEYFHGDNGAGIGASHQTGWTGLVAKLLQQSGA
ncbi:MAG: MGH1-like glycoside hydrolase domain-containing protein [Bryobacteraceae bacterium]